MGFQQERVKELVCDGKSVEAFLHLRRVFGLTEDNAKEYLAAMEIVFKSPIPSLESDVPLFAAMLAFNKDEAATRYQQITGFDEEAAKQYVDAAQFLYTHPLCLPLPMWAKLGCLGASLLILYIAYRFLTWLF